MAYPHSTKPLESALGMMNSAIMPLFSHYYMAREHSRRPLFSRSPGTSGEWAFRRLLCEIHPQRNTDVCSGRAVIGQCDAQP